MRFRHFQTRLLISLLVPLIAVLAAVYVAVTHANTANALTVIAADLERGAISFTRAIKQRNETLAFAGDALSEDFGFKIAYNSTDHPTIVSAMDNLLSRLILADFMALAREATDLLAADTRRPALTNALPEWLPLINAARALDRSGEYPEAADVLILDGHPYHLTILPLFSPELVGWIALGFEINQRFTEEFQESIAAQISVLFQSPDDQWHINGSTLQAAAQQQLLAAYNTKSIANTSATLRLGDDEFVTFTSPLSADGKVAVVLQRSLAAQLAPFDALRQTLFTIFAIGLAALVIALIAIARNVTSPVLQLAAGAKRIATGDYRPLAELDQHDEIGALTLAFNGMARDLAEKEKVRTLLGKVVSPAIAAELLSHDIELGGEEREVTVMFADVRGFTTLCEGRQPRDILSLLNEYFSAVTGCIETHGGVIDKYIGDAVMALFGAPVAHAQGPIAAVRAALDIYRALDGINVSFKARGLDPVSIGIGINTNRVVAGNMGSSARLNYTVIGDGVNLAARLEELTRLYGSRIIVSESTSMAAPEFLYLELDMVRVKGKQQAVRIYEPLLLAANASAELRSFKMCFETFLQVYRDGKFADASALLDTCDAMAGGAGNPSSTQLRALYRARLYELSAHPPSGCWDGIHTFT